MLVYFLRHAEAEDAKSSDFDRALTPKGLEQAEKAGKFCARHGLVPELIVSSPVVRAEQTARIVAKKLGDCPLSVEPWPACGMSAATCLEQLRALAKLDSVMVVGHEPDFSEAIAVLLGVADPESLNVRKASLTLVDLRGFRAGAGRLQALIPVRLM